MKKLLALLAVLLIAVTMTVSAQVAITLAADATTSDLLTDVEGAEFGLGLDTGVTAEFGETGFSASVTLNKTLMPEFSMEYVTIGEAYAYTLGEVDLELSNENVLDINSDIEEDMSGTVTLDATWKFLNAGFDFTYAPESASDLYFGPFYSAELGAGTLDASATVYYLISPDAMLGDIEGEVKYTMPAGPTEIYAGLLPVLYENFEEERALALSIEFGVSYAF